MRNENDARSLQLHDQRTAPLVSFRFIFVLILVKRPGNTETHLRVVKKQTQNIRKKKHSYLYSLMFEVKVDINI